MMTISGLIIITNSKNFKNSNSHYEELDLYLENPPIDKNFCPILFWTNRPQTPLSRLASKYLCLIATSVPSERLFSKLGQIITEKRNRLHPKNANDLLFLNSIDDEYWSF